MNTFEKVLEVPGAASILAAKIAGRVIDQVARGFGEDETLVSELCLFKVIEQKYPRDTISMPNMFKTMRNRAKTETSEGLSEMLEQLTPEQRQIWEADDDLTERQALDAALPKLTDLILQATPDSDRWEDLPVIAQWSLLNKTESTIPEKIATWTAYAETDRTAGKHDTNATRLEKIYRDAVQPMHDIVSEFLTTDTVAEELAEDRARGINVPPRMVA